MANRINIKRGLPSTTSIDDIDVKRILDAIILSVRQLQLEVEKLTKK